MRYGNERVWYQLANNNILKHIGDHGGNFQSNNPIPTVSRGVRTMYLWLQTMYLWLLQYVSVISIKYITGYKTCSCLVANIGRYINVFF